MERLTADKVVEYCPLFQSGGEKPTHDSVSAWVHGFLKAIPLSPETWIGLARDERASVILAPFMGFTPIGRRKLGYSDEELDEDAALIPRMILILRTLGLMREAEGPSAFGRRRSKVGRNDTCPCGSGKKHKRCCLRA
jgi:uncharacterized protein